MFLNALHISRSCSVCWRPRSWASDLRARPGALWRDPSLRILNSRRRLAVRAAGEYRTVSADPLKNPPAADWMMTRRTYDGWGYSPLARSMPQREAPAAVWTFDGHEQRPRGGADRQRA